MSGIRDQDGSTIRILQTQTPDGKIGYIVVVPGIESVAELHADDGRGSDFRGAFDEKVFGDGDYSAGIRKAMRDAGIPTDAPVTLVGHSNGGIAAMNIAHSGEFNVTGVITGGSGVPEKMVGLPDGLEVLQLENSLDVVNRGIQAPTGGYDANGIWQLSPNGDHELHRFTHEPWGDPSRSWLEDLSGHNERYYGDEVQSLFDDPGRHDGGVVDRLRPSFDATVVGQVDVTIYDARPGQSSGGSGW